MRVNYVKNLSAIVNRSFGQKLSRIRGLRDLTQAELGSRIGVSRTTIANLEIGKQNVQLHQVFALARALNTQVQDLIPGSQDLGSDLDVFRNKDQMFIAIAKRHLSSVPKGKRGKENE
ncbi:helix-turn-helix transcriptional regulator [Edaphobacter bradus]|uniref:helix-turn-helix transcriptional regulator n=1 Tax=Edaphobacter bradus TaxID=2259016 RepID=UPI0037C00EFB